MELHISQLRNNMQYIIFYNLDPPLEEKPWPVVRFLYTTTPRPLSTGRSLSEVWLYFQP